MMKEAGETGALHKIDGIMRKEDHVAILKDHLKISARKLKLGQKWVFQMDNDPKQTAKMVTKSLQDNKVNILELNLKEFGSSEPGPMVQPWCHNGYCKLMENYCESAAANLLLLRSKIRREIISSILLSGRIGPDIQHVECYGLRLKHLKSDEIHWLHPDMTVGEVQEKYECLHLEAEWRYDLRIRYLPDNYIESFKKDKTTLLYFYQQLRNDYMQQYATKVSEGMALQLGCLELRRFYKDMPQNALEKRSNFDFLEKEVGLDLFFPRQMQESLKPKQFRKMIQQTFQQYGSLREEECIMRFLNTLSSFTSIDQETYRCELAQGWSITVDLVIGPKGIRQLTTKDSKASGGYCFLVH
ncbi:unnamed protein product [Ranitomeya imitator]|uniref:FERM domain-containing protein n=1 Tax=Ranitomeya imitator TaxID=111125 RepID=A0ABN9LR56_9NEOB|nr:unnamed protein product [Ranitomeya imitator]